MIGEQADGTFKVERIKYATQTKHGHNRRGKVSPEYWIWKEMIQRCHNPKNKRYPRYGARGISVCDEWRNSFEAFLSDVGLKPESHLTLGRKNNDGNYEPGNVRWETMKAQMNNTARNRRISFRGETLTMAEWSARTGIDQGVLRGRLNRGWSAEEALRG